MPKLFWHNLIIRTGFLSAIAVIFLMTLGSWTVKVPHEFELGDKSLSHNYVRRYYWQPRGYNNRTIVIDLSQQRLYAWQGQKLIYSFRISTGKTSTPTPRGRFRITSKYRYHRMRGRGYDIPNVPYAMYFYRGYAIHGAFWHNRFGTPVSRGCVNLPVYQARQLFRWANNGTQVLVRR
jgi:hypothetical protein